MRDCVALTRWEEVGHVYRPHWYEKVRTWPVAKGAMQTSPAKAWPWGSPCILHNNMQSAKYLMQVCGFICLPQRGRLAGWTGCVVFAAWGKLGVRWRLIALRLVFWLWRDVGGNILEIECKSSKLRCWPNAWHKAQSQIIIIIMIKKMTFTNQPKQHKQANAGSQWAIWSEKTSNGKFYVINSMR